MLTAGPLAHSLLSYATDCTQEPLLACQANQPGFWQSDSDKLAITGQRTRSERNPMQDQAVVVGLALKVLAEVWMSDGDERLGALRD